MNKMDVQLKSVLNMLQSFKMWRMRGSRKWQLSLVDDVWNDDGLTLKVQPYSNMQLLARLYLSTAETVWARPRGGRFS